jgi:hypothetical protein
MPQDEVQADTVVEGLGINFAGANQDILYDVCLTAAAAAAINLPKIDKIVWLQWTFTGPIGGRQSSKAPSSRSIVRLELPNNAHPHSFSSTLATPMLLPLMVL